VVHINAGIAGLVAALELGPRQGFGSTAMPPHSLVLTVTGAGLLWVGWFGFNAGSELAADGVAGMAMAVTQIAAATAALVWMLLEWRLHGKPSALGIASGAVGGLVAITPASGFVGPGGALVIGAVAGGACYWGATGLKRRIGYDDSLDCFGVHGVGGIVGALLTGVFAASSLGGVGLAEGVSIGGQLWIQFIAVMATVIYCAVVSLVLLKMIDATLGLRVESEQEAEGLDIALHDERGYTL
jgi:Amt family ammonium transporter